MTKYVRAIPMLSAGSPAGQLLGGVATVGRSCPLRGGRLAAVAALLAAAVVLTTLAGLLLMAAVLVAADALVAHPTRPEGDAADRFRKVQRARRRQATRRRLTGAFADRLPVVEAAGAASERRVLGVQTIDV